MRRVFDRVIAHQVKPVLSIAAHFNIGVFDFRGQFASITPCISPHLRLVLAKVFWFAALLCVIDAPAWSTMLFFQWGPSRIVLASDSLVIQERQGRFERYSQECKIQREGDIFVAMTGASEAGGIDFFSIAKKASETFGPIEYKMTEFHREFEPIVEAYWHELSITPGMRAVTSGGITLVMASVTQHAIGMKRYNMSEGSKEPPNQVWGQGPNRMQTSDAKVSGTFDEAAERIKSDTTINRLQGAAAIIRLFQFQFDAEDARAKRRELRRVGPPISILYIENGRAHWETGYQGKCPDIKP